MPGHVPPNILAQFGTQLLPCVFLFFCSPPLHLSTLKPHLSSGKEVIATRRYMEYMEIR